MPEAVTVSHTLELDFPEDIRDVALTQGEDPDKVCEYIQEFKDMIYGEHLSSYFSLTFIESIQFSLIHRKRRLQSAPYG